MAIIIGSPSRYIQQRDALSSLASYTESFGKNIFVLITESGYKRVEEKLSESIKKVEGSSLTLCYFNGECSKSEVNRIKDEALASKADVIVGIGGGKTMDAAKAAAHYANLPVVICPTAASTDAPCSALSVIYTDDGVVDSYLFLPSNPSIVLMDSTIASKAPVRLLVSGMGDALATYFETRACQKSNATNCLGGSCSITALALSKLCYDTLIKNGYQAMLAAKNGNCTKAVEEIIEANTYLSGIGFESGGLAAAHAIHNGLTSISETHKMYHGEKVAFGVLTQLVLENVERDELEEVISFLMEVGLPVTLEELGIEEIKEEEIRKVAQLACAEADTLHNMPFPVDEDMVYDAIISANELGHYYQDEE